MFNFFKRRKQKPSEWEEYYKDYDFIILTTTDGVHTMQFRDLKLEVGIHTYIKVALPGGDTIHLPTSPDGNGYIKLPIMIKDRDTIEQAMRRALEHAVN